MRMAELLVTLTITGSAGAAAVTSLGPVTPTVDPAHQRCVEEVHERAEETATAGLAGAEAQLGEGLPVGELDGVALADVEELEGLDLDQVDLEEFEEMGVDVRDLDVDDLAALDDVDLTGIEELEDIDSTQELEAAGIDREVIEVLDGSLTGLVDRQCALQGAIEGVEVEAGWRP